MFPPSIRGFSARRSKGNRLNPSTSHTPNQLRSLTRVDPEVREPTNRSRLHRPQFIGEWHHPPNKDIVQLSLFQALFWGGFLLLAPMSLCSACLRTFSGSGESRAAKQVCTTAFIRPAGERTPNSHNITQKFLKLVYTKKHNNISSIDPNRNKHHGKKN